jgi:hypothetical protein
VCEPQFYQRVGRAPFSQPVQGASSGTSSGSSGRMRIM